MVSASRYAAKFCQNVPHDAARSRVEAWALRSDTFVREKVTEGVFTYVAIGPDGRPRKVLRDVEEA